MTQYKIILSKKAGEDLDHIIKNPRMRRRTQRLLDAIALDPRTGIGKPERLKHYKSEAWSRRIDRKNRIGYLIKEN